jgi:uncharacterized protein (TIGR00156 family)
LKCLTGAQQRQSIKTDSTPQIRFILAWSNSPVFNVSRSRHKEFIMQLIPTSIRPSLRSTRTFSRNVVIAAFVAGALIGGVAFAQGSSGPAHSAIPALQHYTGPSTPGASVGYAGPTSLQPTTVKALIDHGKDDQHAILRGRIVSFDGGEHYTFADSTGQMRVEIDVSKFPVGRPVDEKMTVEVTGELDRDRRSVEFEVDELRVL